MLVPLIFLNMDNTAPPVTAPVILVNPFSQAVVPGGSATFQVYATGNSLAYQWYKNGTAISGATASSYSTPAAVYATDNGAQFTVVVSNTAGIATSTAAILTVVIPPVVPVSNPAIVLSGYVTQVRRMLHDLSAQMWPNQELIDYINEARNRVAQDTKCLRTLVTGINLVQGQDMYILNNVLNLYQNRVIDVMGITLYWGASRFKMTYKPFTELDAYVRTWQNYQSRPVMFSRMGGTSIFVGPVPDQTYVTDWDVALIPQPLASDTDVETLSPPFTDLVKYWAAYLAKFKEQSLGEAQIFKNEYMSMGRIVARAYMTRVVPDPYLR